MRDKYGAKYAALIKRIGHEVAVKLKGRQVNAAAFLP